ncbi:metal-dependent hydrolase [Halosolutus gelatinilyticus]|uniref:metal-dependent hydrolase n=1 Tax=Halosolutus gelatinilyticus TaxID=2931975 RepID=UPI001FF4E4DA|nr:metal-dependent hydrolase [Halosolutus gelatinilyticus]
MWPWEHAIVAYLVYSLFVRLVYRDSPGGLEVVLVVFASVLPDLIDKPLAWEFGIFETGYALGHSVFFAVPLAILIGAAARVAGRSRLGLAFGAGYLLHLPADVFDSYVRGGVVQFEILLWPIAPVPTYQEPITSFKTNFIQLFGRYQQDLLSGAPSTYLRLQLALAAVAVLVWLADGAPVLRECFRGAKRIALGAIGLASDSSGESPRHR